MHTKVHEVIKQLSAAFRKKFDDYKGLYLFGAYLDEREHEDEDIEIVALFEVEDRSKRGEIWPIIGQVETANDVTIDLYPYTEEEFKKDEELYQEVMETGRFYNPLGITKRSKV